MLNINYKTDYSKGNRDATTYHNFCLALKYDDQDGIRQIRQDASASGLSQAQIEAKYRSALKSKIANDKPVKKAYVKHYPVSKKLLKTDPGAKKSEDLTLEFNNLQDAKLDHPYLKKKQIKPLGIKQSGNILHVPFFNHENLKKSNHGKP